MAQTWKKPEQQQCRPREHLTHAGKLYPDAWRMGDAFHAERGKDGMPDWPGWCYLPLAGWYAIVCADAGVQRLGTDLIVDVARLAAMGTWRMTQGIYRFDPDLYAAVVDTPVAGDIPCDILYCLPEWCIYIETPGITWGGKPVHGVWAHLDADANTGGTELRFLADVNNEFLPIILHLGAWSLAESIERALAKSVTQARGVGSDVDADTLALGAGELAGIIRAQAEPLVSLLLYLCSQNAEIGDGVRVPANPEPKHTKRGARLFAPTGPTTWDVGVRMGSALRRAHRPDAGSADQGDAHAGPRPHIRRAHWHGFRSGPMKRADGSEIAVAERKFALRWLPPIPVNLNDAGDLPATVRTVMA